MKKSQAQLLKLASKFQNKYAQSAVQDTIQQAVSSAASWGQKTHGIMNFPEQLKKDQASLSMNVSKSGKTITVSPPTVNPGEYAPNYSSLPMQVKSYLEKYLELFPKDVGDVELTLQYSGQTPGSGIAQN